MKYCWRIERRGDQVTGRLCSASLSNRPAPFVLFSRPALGVPVSLRARSGVTMAAGEVWVFIQRGMRPLLARDESAPPAAPLPHQSFNHPSDQTRSAAPANAFHAAPSFIYHHKVFVCEWILLLAVRKWRPGRYAAGFGSALVVL